MLEHGVLHVVQGHLFCRGVFGQLRVEVAAPVGQHHLVSSVEIAPHRNHHVTELLPRLVLVEEPEEILALLRHHEVSDLQGVFRGSASGPLLSGAHVCSPLTAGAIPPAVFGAQRTHTPFLHCSASHEILQNRRKSNHFSYFTDVVSTNYCP